MPPARLSLRVKVTFEIPFTYTFTVVPFLTTATWFQVLSVSSLAEVMYTWAETPRSILSCDTLASYIKFIPCSDHNLALAPLVIAAPVIYTHASCVKLEVPIAGKDAVATY